MRHVLQLARRAGARHVPAKAPLQAGTDTPVAAQVPQGIHCQRHGGWTHRRPHRHTAGDRLRERSRVASAGWCTMLSIHG